MPKNCYEMAIELFEIGEAIKQLGNIISNSNSSSDVETFLEQLEILNNEFSTIKESLKAINYKEIKKEGWNKWKFISLI